MIPVPEQPGVLREVADVLGAADRLIGTLSRQVDLLREHRQAIVTAAVAGNLRIPRVAA
jgi:hypothetical protein